MTSPSEALITEVLPEPGCSHVWVTFDDLCTHRIDLTPLMDRPAFQALNVPRVLGRVSVTPDQRHLTWPGGARLSADCILRAPDGFLPLIPVAVAPVDQRYRPLLPYLRHLRPAVYLRPAPVDSVTVQQLLGLRAPELSSLLSNTLLPQEPVLNRLYDLAVFLNEHFAQPHVHAMVRLSWPYALRQCPDQPMLHTLLGCLQHHRPDLIERPCMLLATGGL